MRRIEVPTDIPTGFELGDMAADIQRRMEEMRAREREEAVQKQSEEAEKHAKTNRSDIEMDTEDGGETGTSKSHSRHKKGHMANIYLWTKIRRLLWNFVKDNEKLHDKTNEHFKDKARKEYLWERFANSRKLSFKVCKTWFKFRRTNYSKLTQSKSGQAPKEMTKRQNRIN